MFSDKRGMIVNKSRIALSVILNTLFLVSVSDAKLGDWKTYTATNNIRAVAKYGEYLWVGTSGGVFRYNQIDSTYLKFNNSNGLTTNDVTALAIDSSGSVWIGYANGAIDVYSPSNGSWRYISDIYSSTNINKNISGFFFSGDSLYISTGFGIALFSVSKFEFRETYVNFFSIAHPQVNSLYLHKNRLYAIANEGLFVSKPTATNFLIPESWERISIVKGNSLALFNDSIYIGNDSGVYVFKNNTLNKVSEIRFAKILFSTDTALVFSNSNNLFLLRSNYSVESLTSTPDFATCGIITNSSTLYIGFNNQGLNKYANNSWSAVSPNGPNSNLFYQMVVDDNSTLWAVSGGIVGNGKGFYSFDGSQWKNYTASKYPLMINDNFYAIDIGPNNSKWISNWGEGIVVVDSKGDIVRRFDYNYPGFIGVIRNEDEGIPSYTVPGKIAVDKSGAVWLTIFASLNASKVLWKMNPDSSWDSIPGSPYGSHSFMQGITIDNNDTKWFINAVVGRAPESVALVYYNQKSALPNTTNGWGTITESEGLSNNYIYTIAVDKTGDIWLGTGTGITIITNPNNPQERVSQIFLVAVRDQSINCIAVDALNNKWVGTTSRGVFVLSPDGTQLLEQYNVENTDGKLVDNNVQSIAFDRKKGIAYFGTEKGLSSLEITSIAAKSLMSTIDLSPNPVYLPSHETVEIRGLAEESIIKVITIYGKVLKQFPAQGGGRAFWDCKDGEGNSVASGVYIIVAHDKNGTQIATAKIAVIRK